MYGAERKLSLDRNLELSWPFPVTRHKNPVEPFRLVNRSRWMMAVPQSGTSPLNLLPKDHTLATRLAPGVLLG